MGQFTPPQIASQVQIIPLFPQFVAPPQSHNCQTNSPMGLTRGVFSSAPPHGHLLPQTPTHHHYLLPQQHKPQHNQQTHFTPKAISNAFRSPKRAPRSSSTTPRVSLHGGIINNHNNINNGKMSNNNGVSIVMPLCTMHLY